MKKIDQSSSAAVTNAIVLSIELESESEDDSNYEPPDDEEIDSEDECDMFDLDNEDSIEIDDTGDMLEHANMAN